MLEEFYKTLRFGFKDMIIFPGSNLKDVFRYSIFIAILSTITNFLDVLTFLNPIGAWTGVFVLAIACFVGGIGESNQEEE